MKCSSCGHWNSVSVNTVFLEQPSPEPKVKVMIPMYQLLEISRYEKCGKIIAEPKELISAADLYTCLTSYKKVKVREVCFTDEALLKNCFMKRYSFLSLRQC